MAERAATTGKEQEARIDLVLEGGGVKGIALIGALSVLEERGFQTQNVAGASAGAIVAALHSAGYIPLPNYRRSSGSSITTVLRIGPGRTRFPSQEAI